MSVDWGVGRYELTAQQLLPASYEVVDVAAPLRGERVLDVGCGTGNAALVAAERGATVLGVDPSPRLLDVARRRAAVAGLDVRFVVGEAAAPPVPDGSVDVVTSVFAAVFALDPAATLAGLTRVLAPNGRLVMSAWIPGNAISLMNQAVMGAMRDALGEPPADPPFRWHDPDEVQPLAAKHRLGLTVSERSLAFTASSVDAYLDREADNHPLAVTARAVLERQGTWDGVRRQAREVLEAGNEEPAAFRVTSRYLILSLTRS